jgi:hypothetical protein
LEVVFDFAENNMGIPKLLDAEDMTNVPKPDERSVIIYISQFVNYQINQLEKSQIPAKTNTTIKVIDQVNEEEEIDSAELPISNIDSFNWEEVRADGIFFPPKISRQFFLNRFSLQTRRWLVTFLEEKMVLFTRLPTLILELQRIYK